ncbi:MAG TPA: hypothetical protein DCG51_00810 [Erysipelotrichaceae bacterium]|jgi:hypothetical protein|nr:hypothetical protein [Solobacterium sp.]HAE15063.1 hypothetical protein [Erysipelotrichaceae bacterium]
MNKMTLKQIFWLFAVGFLTYFVIRYMWPLLLVIFGIMLYGYFRMKKQIRQAEDSLNDTVYKEVQKEPREQKPQLNEDDVIDAEFTVKNRDEMKMRG